MSMMQEYTLPIISKVGGVILNLYLNFYQITIF